MYLLFFFFFQAEDGIRDYKVTGVQTCALPICHRRDPRWQSLWQLEKSRGRGFSKKHHCLHRLRYLDGSLGALRNSRDDTRTRARSLQHWRLLYAWRSALLFHLERLLHEETPRG